MSFRKQPLDRGLLLVLRVSEVRAEQAVKNDNLFSVNKTHSAAAAKSSAECFLQGAR